MGASTEPGLLPFSRLLLRSVSGDPRASGSCAAAANGALDGFVMSAAVDMPRPGLQVRAAMRIPAITGTTDRRILGGGADCS